MKNSIIRQIVVAVLLGTGFGVAWGFGLGGVGSFVTSLFGPISYGDYEDIVVDHFGKPFIQVRVDNDWDTMQYRTLDGNEVKLRRDDVNSPSTLAGPYRPPKLFDYPITWRERIVGITGGEDPPVSWVLMRDDSRPGKAWFVGHQPRSKQIVGYIGRKGLRSSLPPEDEKFNVGNRSLDYSSRAITTTGYANPGTLGYGSIQQWTNSGRIQPWMIYLADGGVVREIDLRTREVRSLGEFDDLISMGIAEFTPLGVENPEKQTLDQRLVIRSRDRVVIFNTFENSQSEFTLPETLQAEQFRVSTVGEEQLLLHLSRGDWERGRVVELMWINREGVTQDQQTVQLVGYNNPTKPSDAVIPALLSPSFLPWVLGVTLVAPIGMLQDHQAATYAAAMAEIWHFTWMGITVIAVLSLILTVVVYRWQQKYSRPHTLIWTVFVFLTTLPGFFAYWAMHRREPLAACPHCKHEVPRNREKCANCVEPFPEPKLLGTEVFA
jgi:hypothetical protein